MSLAQFRSGPVKYNGKIHEGVYNQLVESIGEPSLIDDQMTFAYWYRPSIGETKYYTISIDSLGINCSVQASYNINNAKLLLDTTRRAWFEPGRELLTVNGRSLVECNALLTTVTMLIDGRIPSIEFDYFVSQHLTSDIIRPKLLVKPDDGATPGRPVGPSSSKRQIIPAPLKTYTTNGKK